MKHCWTQHGYHTHEVIVAVVSYLKPAQAQANQKSTIDKKLLAVHSCGEKKNHPFFENLTTRRFPKPQWMALYSSTFEQN